ncbi:MAG TPA: DUF523 domain-containing protein [Dissulfurispiraceae bacterium]|nr:DUF523 domain-containing protein [Dissulfurispiraceae bacterium]
MTDRVKLGISSCLLGNKVRYDGGGKLDLYLRDDFGRFVEWVPLCPEVEMGLTVPREPMQLKGDAAFPRLVTENTAIDHTDAMLQWVEKKLKMLSRMNIRGFVFKSRSPSCGIRDLPVYSPSGIVSEQGAGIFALEFMKRFPLLPVEDETSLADATVRDIFIARILEAIHGDHT